MAATIDFPLIINPSTVDLELEDTTLRSKYSEGSCQSRPRYSKIRTTLCVAWVALTEIEKSKIEEFYRITTKGGALAFNFIEPISQKSYVVRFAEAPNMKGNNLNYWNLSMKCEEV